MAEISLTSSMRNNLLSLQQTAKLQDLTQNRLATGLKVNSAIDNPSSYYTAQSLSNRAEDLNVLLDAMSQGIQTLKAVNESIETGTKFLEQAKSVANSALETAQPIIAKVNSEAELLAAVQSGKQGLIVLNSDITMSTNQNIELQDGQSLVGARYLDKNAAQTKLSFNFNSQSGFGIITKTDSLVSDLDINFTTNKRQTGAIITLGNTVLQNTNITISAENAVGEMWHEVVGVNANNSVVDIKGQLKINEIVADKNNPQSYFTYGIVAGTINIGDSARVDIDLSGRDFNYGIVNNTVNMSGNGILNVKTGAIGLHNINLNMNDDAIINVDSVYGAMNGTTNLNDRAVYNVAGSYGFSTGRINLNSVQAQLNISSTLKAFSRDHGQYSQFTAVQGAQINTKDGLFKTTSAISVLTPITTDGSTLNSAFVLENTTPPPVLDIKQEIDKTYINSAKETKDDTSLQYNQILSQYDSLINDSWYKGVNLLKQQDLKVVFNESRSSDLEIKGVDATTKGLGLEQADWNDAGLIQTSLNQIDDAINQLRIFASEFGNYYQIVTARENFTNSLINVLTEGADALTLADMNQESANMLALQTRQQLAVNSLSLASQASQSVLKLF